TPSRYNAPQDEQTIPTRVIRGPQLNNLSQHKLVALPLRSGTLLRSRPHLAVVPDGKVNKTIHFGTAAPFNQEILHACLNTRFAISPIRALAGDRQLRLLYLQPGAILR